MNSNNNNISSDDDSDSSDTNSNSSHDSDSGNRPGARPQGVGATQRDSHPQKSDFMNLFDLDCGE